MAQPMASPITLKGRLFPASGTLIIVSQWWPSSGQIKCTPPIHRRWPMSSKAYKQRKTRSGFGQQLETVFLWLREQWLHRRHWLELDSFRASDSVCCCCCVVQMMTSSGRQLQSNSRVGKKYIFSYMYRDKYIREVEAIKQS